VTERALRALVLLYYFPPSGGPGVQRGLKLCARLASLGIEATVVTVAPETYDGPGEYAPDPSLGYEIPPGLRVVRTSGGGGRRLRAALSAARLYGAAWRLAPRRFFERQAAWFAPALEASIAEVRRSRPDVVLTSSQPYVAHLVGRELRLRTGVPWVADFRDPWTDSWGRAWPSEGTYQWECDREDETLFDADRVVSNTPGSRRELLARRPWIDASKVDVVPNGYDPADFVVEPAPRNPAEVLVVHGGAFRAKPPGAEVRGLRATFGAAAFSPWPYDLSTHSPATLFRAMAQAGARGAPRTIRALLVGALDARWIEFARSLGVADRVEATGYLAHRAATSRLLAADLLYLPTITRADGAAVSNVPAKAYEYLGSGRPVAALAGLGDVRDLVADRARVVVLDPRDVAGLADLLAATAAGAGPPACGPDPADVHAWRRDELAVRMAETLRRAVAPPGADAAAGYR
jgi:glycosyltransferase involved in cell wall biosynthesis